MVSQESKSPPKGLKRKNLSVSPQYTPLPSTGDEDDEAESSSKEVKFEHARTAEYVNDL